MRSQSCQTPDSTPTVATRAAFGRRDVIVLIVVLAAAAAFGIPTLQRVNREGRRTRCLANLSTIGTAMGEYIAHSGGHWPAVARLPSAEYHQPAWPSLPSVLSPFLGKPSDVFRCPADRRLLAEDHPLRKRFGARTTYFESEGSSYEWVLQELLAGQAVGRDPLARAEGLGMGPADQPIVWDFEPFHAHGDEKGAFNILYGDLKARPERGELRLTVGQKR